ncbi:MAG TPA: Gfo/Idh/MocA family oxidoreductase [Bryobacteraceae bacterium]|nr:Gfo/Idh/MocA family oxidoreductase [Bryobacteraceae bacterium]
MNRRHFLVTTAAAPAAFAQTAEKRVSTAVIGTGNRGSYLLTSILEQPNARVAALCDTKPERLDKAATAAARHNPKTYSDWRRIVDSKDIDAVFVATPPHLHSEMASAALRAGKHVYCEKPIGITVDQVKQLVAAAKASKNVFMAGQQMRSHRQLGEAIRKIHEGIIGNLMMVRAHRFSSEDLDHNGASSDWFFDVSKSGGYLIEMSVHNLDLCNWIIGAHPSRAAGFGGILRYKNDPPGRTIMDGGLITYDYPNGVKMAYALGVFHPNGMPGGGQSVAVYGDKAAVDLLYTTNMSPLGERRPVPRPLAEKQEEPPHAHTTAFYECILNGSKNPADITIGATAALTAILGHEAMTKERVVNWKDFGIQL